jgi:transcriptional regulator with XRE-family HTH domain
MKEYGMTQYALHQKTNFSYDNFRKWLDGATEPYADSLERLAQAFDCSVDYLIGRVS